jgi:hypothetical protein
MKVALLILAVAIGSAACRKEEGFAPKEPEVRVVDTIPRLKYSGTFTSGPYGKVMGEVRIYKQQGKYFLLLDDFKSSAGPNLHIYLSREKMPVNYHDVGQLKSLNEPQRYQIEANLDDKPYGFICIYCVDNNHLFGWAKL